MRLDANQPAAPAKKGGLGSTIAAEVEAEVAHLIGVGDLDDFQAIEIAARQVALQLMGQAV
ncbi:MAG: hypothetical protein F4Y02_08880 [Chloroflexi bacterium]|nr:hypothetical protein [Chloroflexota bacterium]